MLRVLRRHNLGDALPAALAHLAFNRLREARLIRHPHTSFLGRIWKLKENLTAYDATYVALAEALDAPLITLDERLAQPRATALRWSCTGKHSQGRPEKALIAVIQRPIGSGLKFVS